MSAELCAASSHESDVAGDPEAGRRLAQLVRRGQALHLLHRRQRRAERDEWFKAKILAFLRGYCSPSARLDWDVDGRIASLETISIFTSMPQATSALALWEAKSA